MYKLKKIKQGQYLYRGFKIFSYGYYPPEQRVVWEAQHTKNYNLIYGFTRKELVTKIDNYYNTN
jgi:hypothetical protein